MVGITGVCALVFIFVNLIKKLNITWFLETQLERDTRWLYSQLVLKICRGFLKVPTRPNVKRACINYTNLKRGLFLLQLAAHF